MAARRSDAHSETKDFMPRAPGKRVESRPSGEGITISPEYVRDTLFPPMYAAISGVDPNRPSGGDDAAGAVFSASLRGVFLPNSAQDPTGVVEWDVVMRTNAWFRKFLDWKGYAHASMVSVRLDRCRGIGAEGGSIVTLVVNKPGKLKAEVCARCGLPSPCHLSSSSRP